MKHARGGEERGFALLLVFVLAGIIAISLYKEIPRVAFEKQRDREQLLVDRGGQYARGIQLFYRKFGRYPAKMEDLENTNNLRFLRHKYKDPLTNSDEWRIIHMGPGGVLTDSLVQKLPDPNASKDKPQGDGTQAGNTSGTGGASGTGGSAGDPNAPSAGLNLAMVRRPSDRVSPNPTGGLPVDPNGDPNQQLQNPPPQFQYPVQPQPGQPGYPSVPVNPGAPGQPVDPNQPFQPGDPNQPQQPLQPGDPNQPQQPLQPDPNQPQPQPGFVTPRQFVTPGQPPVLPNQPYSPNPSNPNQPFVPNQPFAPNPGNPNQPFIPNQPYPNQPGTRGGAGFGGGVPQFPNPNTGQFNAGGSNPATNLIQTLLTTPRQPPSGIGTGAVPGGNVIGAGIAGVASKYEGEGIKLINEKKKYKEWEFVYDFKNDKSRTGVLPGQQPTGVGQTSPNGPAPPSPLISTQPTNPNPASPTPTSPNP